MVGIYRVGRARISTVCKTWWRLSGFAFHPVVLEILSKLNNEHHAVPSGKYLVVRCFLSMTMIPSTLPMQ